jgi:hypothetical protein
MVGTPKSSQRIEEPYRCLGIDGALFRGEQRLQRSTDDQRKQKRHVRMSVRSGRDKLFGYGKKVRNEQPQTLAAPDAARS